MSAPVSEWQVTLQRKYCMSASQNARQCVAYVKAACQHEAMKTAEQLAPNAAFLAISARRTT